MQFAAAKKKLENSLQTSKGALAHLHIEDSRVHALTSKFLFIFLLTIYQRDVKKKPKNQKTNQNKKKRQKIA